MPFLDKEDRELLWKPNVIGESKFRDERGGYYELNRQLAALKMRSESEWMDAVRWYGRNDLFYLLNFIMTNGLETHAQYKDQLFHFHPYFLEKCRKTELHAIKGHGLDASGRGSSKSTIRSKAFPIMMILNYPDIAMIIFSAEKKLALKHAGYIRQELTENKKLKTWYSDILWQDPKKETMELGLPWSAEEGFTVKRTIPRKNATVEAHAAFGGGPVGSRPDMLLIDDLERSDSVTSEKNIKDLMDAFSETVSLVTPTRIPHRIIMISNTQFSEAGLVKAKMIQYAEEDPDLVMATPMEDLSIPGDGPMGGTPNYPATSAFLHDQYNEMQNKEEYAFQFALSFKVASSFKEDAIVFFKEPVKEVAKNCVTYICIDASRGVYDPTGMWVWGIDPIGHKWWLDGVRRKLDPTKPEFITEIEMLLEKWQHNSQRVVQIRVDQLGNQPWAELIKSELMRRGVSIVPVIPCTSKGKNSGRFDNGKNERIYQFWSPMLNRGEVHFPTPASSGGIGIPYFDEEGKQHCLVDYFLKYEYGMFPRSKFDDMLDAGALIEEDKANKEHPLQRGSDRINNYRGVEATRRVSGLSWKSSY